MDTETFGMAVYDAMRDFLKKFDRGTLSEPSRMYLAISEGAEIAVKAWLVDNGDELIQVVADRVSDRMVEEKFAQ